jgi:hypothetical protein
MVVACCCLACPTSFHILSSLVAVSPVRTCDVPEDSLVPRLYGRILTMSVPLSPRSLLVVVSRVRPPAYLLVTVLPARSCDVPEALLVPRLYGCILTMSVPSSPRLFMLLARLYVLHICLPSYVRPAHLPVHARTCDVPKDSLVPRLYRRILTMSVPSSPQSLLVAVSCIRPPHSTSACRLACSHMSCS